MSKKKFATTELTLKVVSRLRTLKPGDVIGWPELSAILGLNAQEEGRHYVTSACRIMLRDGQVYEGEVGVGIRHLNDEDITSIGRREHRRIFKRAKRAVRKLTCLKNWSALTLDQRTEYEQGLAKLGYLQSLTKPQLWKEKTAKTPANQSIPTRPTDIPPQVASA